MKNRVCIIGGGPVGCSLGVVLQRRGFKVSIFEKNSDIRIASPNSGRSINLVLTRRGLRLAKDLNLETNLMEYVVKVGGRCVHPIGGDSFSQAYGLSGECNYSINRSLLNQFWISQAEHAGCEFFFGHTLQSLTTGDSGEFRFHSGNDIIPVIIEMSEFDFVFGCDGGGSVVRNCLSTAGLVHSEESLLSSGYKEVVFPAKSDGSYSLDPNLLHIWPRSGHMLMALANTDGSFTGTVFMERKRSSHDASFDEACESYESALGFLRTYYQSALDVLPPEQLEVTVGNFINYRQGILGTVRCHPWLVEPTCTLQPHILLLGDAAHAIVPFFGQGVNCGFEDVVVLNRLLEFDNLETAIRQFACTRKQDSDAIAALALENFEEMKSHVANEEFLNLKKLEAWIMLTFPTLYRSRYTMVMYSGNSYSACQALGEVQKGFLKLVAAKFRVDAHTDLDACIDREDLREMLCMHISPVADELGVSFEF